MMMMVSDWQKYLYIDISLKWPSVRRACWAGHELKRFLYWHFPCEEVCMDGGDFRNEMHLVRWLVGDSTLRKNGKTAWKSTTHRRRRKKPWSSVYVEEHITCYNNNKISKYYYFYISKLQKMFGHGWGRMRFKVALSTSPINCRV